MLVTGAVRRLNSILGVFAATNTIELIIGKFDGSVILSLAGGLRPLERLLAWSGFAQEDHTRSTATENYLVYGNSLLCELDALDRWAIYQPASSRLRKPVENSSECLDDHFDPSNSRPPSSHNYPQRCRTSIGSECTLSLFLQP